MSTPTGNDSKSVYEQMLLGGPLRSGKLALPSRVDHSDKKLGKMPARHDHATLEFATYATPLLKPAPLSADFTAKVLANLQNVPGPWGMMLNDRIGDCTTAAAGHMIMLWTANADRPMVTIPDSSILAAYEAITGYNPAVPSSDTGAYERDVLAYWSQTGIGGDRIETFVALEPSNRAHVRDAVFYFTGCYIGLSLPKSAQTQAVWAVPPGGTHGTGAPGSWGGHAVPVVGYDERGLTVVTWGELKRMTWGFWEAYCDEAYALLSPDYFTVPGKSPEGFDIDCLRRDLNVIKASLQHKALARAGGRKLRAALAEAASADSGIKTVKVTAQSEQPIVTAEIVVTTAAGQTLTYLSPDNDDRTTMSAMVQTGAGGVLTFRLSARMQAQGITVNFTLEDAESGTPSYTDSEDSDSSGLAVYSDTLIF